jgi:hypothetical protein
MTLEMNGNVAFGVMSVETGGARKLTVSTRVVESSLPADPNAMARVQKMQVYLGRVNLGGVGGKLQTAGMVAGGGIVLGIVVIVITAIRRSKPAPQPVANPYQDRPSEPPVSGQSPSADTPGQGGRQIPPPQQ